MITIASISLAGGQGKTTTAIALAKVLAVRGHRVLIGDCDPQSNTTIFLLHQSQEDEPTMYEVIRGSLSHGKFSEGEWSEDFKSCIYPTSHQGLSLIPSDDGLDGIQDFLSSSGFGAMLLRQRLKPFHAMFDFCVLDAPPQRSQLTRTVLGAADGIIIPVETKEKGYECLLRTMEAIAIDNEMREQIGTPTAQVLGILPFRLRIVGNNPVKSQREILEAITAAAKEIDVEVFPPIVESTIWEKSFGTDQLPTHFDKPELLYSVEVIANAVERLGGTDE